MHYFFLIFLLFVFLILTRSIFFSCTFLNKGSAFIHPVCLLLFFLCILLDILELSQSFWTPAFHKALCGWNWLAAREIGLIPQGSMNFLMLLCGNIYYGKQLPEKANDQLNVSICRSPSVMRRVTATW